MFPIILFFYFYFFKRNVLFLLLVFFAVGGEDLHLELEMVVNCNFLSSSVDACAEVHSPDYFATSKS